MKRYKLIYVLIALNILLVLFRNTILPEDAIAAFTTSLEATLSRLGPLGYGGIIVAYVVCGLFFVPLLIPLNILGGALYGAWVGTAIALAGITLATVASIGSVRYLFTEIQSRIEKHPSLKRLIANADRHCDLVILTVRFSVFVPYLLQNIALAATNISAARITLITAVSAIPGAAIYSFLGAGLVAAEQASQLVVYVLIPVVILLVLATSITYFRAKASRLIASPHSTDDTHSRNFEDE